MYHSVFTSQKRIKSHKFASSLCQLFKFFFSVYTFDLAAIKYPRRRLLQILTPPPRLNVVDSLLQP